MLKVANRTKSKQQETKVKKVLKSRPTDYLHVQLVEQYFLL